MYLARQCQNRSLPSSTMFLMLKKAFADFSIERPVKARSASRAAREAVCDGRGRGPGRSERRPSPFRRAGWRIASILRSAGSLPSEHSSERVLHQHTGKVRSVDPDRCVTQGVSIAGRLVEWVSADGCLSDRGLFRAEGSVRPEVRWPAGCRRSQGSKRIASVACRKGDL